jgi:hypothetical protein
MCLVRNGSKGITSRGFINALEKRLLEKLGSVFVYEAGE